MEDTNIFDVDPARLPRLTRLVRELLMEVPIHDLPVICNRARDLVVMRGSYKAWELPSNMPFIIPEKYRPIKDSDDD